MLLLCCIILHLLISFTIPSRSFAVAFCGQISQVMFSTTLYYCKWFSESLGLQMIKVWSKMEKLLFSKFFICQYVAASGAVLLWYTASYWKKNRLSYVLHNFHMNKFLLQCRLFIFIKLWLLSDHFHFLTFNKS